MEKLTNKSTISIKSKTIVFSGGSGYLGEAMVSHLLHCGAYVINLGRREPKILSSYPEKGKHFSVDFYNTESLVDILESINANTKSIDILVNNAFDFSHKTGFNNPSGRIENITKEIFFNGMESGLYWPLLCSQIIGKKMKQQNRGNIVNIASLYSFLVADYRMYKDRKTFNPVIYPIAKHGILGLTKYIASFWSEFNIRCNCLTPGTFPNTTRNNEDSYSSNRVTDEGFIKILEKKCSVGRVGVPTDLLSTIEFLCSDKSAYLTGSNIVVDGGWSVL